MEEHAVVNVNIKNFKGIKKCPISGKKPEEMRWEDGKITMLCDGSPENEKISVEYGPEELSLQNLTWKLIEKWNNFCNGTAKVAG